MAKKILSGELQAYSDTISQIDPFIDIYELGSRIEFNIENAKQISVQLYVNSEEVIPSEAKSLLKSGKLSVKSLPKTKFLELYQDYVCSCVLRVSRELFALLPIDIVKINALGKLLNTKTGYKEDTIILSVIIPRETLNNLNLDHIDPSDSMDNFAHSMSFKKSKGFEPVEEKYLD